SSRSPPSGSRITRPSLTPRGSKKLRRIHPNSDRRSSGSSPRYSSSCTAEIAVVSRAPDRPRAASSAYRPIGVRPVAATTEALGVAAITSAAMSAPTRPSSSALSTTWMRMPATRSARTHERRPEPVTVAPIDHLAQLDHPSGPVLGLLLAPEQWLAGLEPEQLGAAFVGSDRLH